MGKNIFKSVEQRSSEARIIAVDIRSVWKGRLINRKKREELRAKLDRHEARQAELKQGSQSTSASRPTRRNNDSWGRPRSSHQRSLTRTRRFAHATDEIVDKR